VSTFGVEFTIKLNVTVDQVDEMVENFYTSLAGNFALVNIDVAWNPERSELLALLAVDAPEGFDDDMDFAIGVGSDAFKKALRESGVIDTSDDADFVPSSQVLVFA
jgi:hypothetical protein